VEIQEHDAGICKGIMLLHVMVEKWKGKQACTEEIKHERQYPFVTTYSHSN
jgi:hypothetical protein